MDRAEAEGMIRAIIDHIGDNRFRNGVKATPGLRNRIREMEGDDGR